MEKTARSSAPCAGPSWAASNTAIESFWLWKFVEIWPFSWYQYIGHNVRGEPGASPGSPWAALGDPRGVPGISPGPRGIPRGSPGNPQRVPLLYHDHHDHDHDHDRYCGTRSASRQRTSIDWQRAVQSHVDTYIYIYIITPNIMYIMVGGHPLNTLKMYTSF